MTDWKSIADKILARVLKEWRDQGHNLSGKVESTAKTYIEELVGVIKIKGELLYYTKYVNSGVSAANIPFSPPSGRGGTSKYIQGLIEYAKARGMKNPKSAAFAIAMKHKKEGMPTKASKRFSSTGKRIEFIEDAFTAILPELDKLVIEQAGNEIENSADKIFATIGNQRVNINV